MTNSGFSVKVSNNEAKIDAWGSASSYRSKRDQILVVVDGFLINHNIPDLPSISKGLSKSELVYQTYLKYGTELSNHVYGQYVCFIHDGDKKILVQDSIGLRTLYFKENSQLLHVSTDLSVFNKTLSPENLNLEYIADYLEFGDPISRHTPIKEVTRTLFGETILFTNNNREKNTPFIKKIESYKPPASEDEIINELHLRFSEALKICEDFNQEIWCEVSGGLDSGSVFYFSKLLNVDIQPLSVISKEGLDDGDTSIIQSISANQAPWHIIKAENYPPFGAFPKYSNPEPGNEIHCLLTEKYDQLLKSNKVDFLLTGLGGDQIFGGSDCLPVHLSDHLWSFEFQKLFSESRKYSEKSNSKRHPLFWLYHYALLPSLTFLQGRRFSSSSIYNRNVRWLSKDFIKKHSIGSRWKNLDLPKLKTPGKNVLLQDVLLLAASEASSPSSLFTANVYHPLLHPSLVEFMLSLPSHHRNSPDGDRMLQRKYFRNIIPEVILKRIQKGTITHIFQKQYSLASNWHKELQKDSILVNLGVFDEVEWRAAVEKSRFGSFESLKHFIASVTLEIWLRNVFRAT